ILLRKRAKQDFEDNNLDLPTMNYKLPFVMLENSEEYKNKAVFSRLYPGDTATFIHDEDGINVKARMTDYTWSPSQKEEGKGE
ncbi:phage tail protein, partial [Bacillus velezensis]|uniref:phage tail protein n=1 Tax=Bacillus velezensis TaxID=492670 RepID=UPI0015678257